LARYRETMTIWPYRSLSPRGFALVMIALGALAFCIGLGFFLMGAWPVIGFLGLELLVVWFAFRMNYRAARRRQHLTATGRQLTIETVSPAGDSQTTEVPTAWAQVELTPRDEPEMRARERQRVIVRSHGRATEIGGFLHPAETPKLAREVKRMISRAREAAMTDEQTPAGGQLNTQR
jgi:uncharacterized membrane protein